MVTKRQAESLAVRYHAYMVASNEDDLSGVETWGPMLLSIQEQTGIELISSINIEARLTALRQLRENQR